MNSPHSQPDCRERIDAARRLIEQRLDEDIPLEELAEAAHYSMFHFHRLFRGLMGETAREHVRRLRLERAAHRLTHGHDDILGIALDAGYESHEAFTRAFKSQFDATPSVFRSERRECGARRASLQEEDPMDVRIETRKPCRIAAVRHVGPYDQVGSAWSALMKWGWSKMMFRPPETFGLCHNDPEVTAPERVRYDACMVVDEKAKPKGDVQIREMPGGVYAAGLHEGSFDSIGDTYARLFARISSRPIEGRSWQLGDPPSIEKYLNDPRKTPPEKLKTEIWMPVSDSRSLG